MATQKISLPLAAKLIRRMHQTRLSAFDVVQYENYEGAVVARVLDFLIDRDDEPQSHSHSFEEMGMCVECDAAAALLMWRDVCDIVAKEVI